MSTMCRHYEISKPGRYKDILPPRTTRILSVLKGRVCLSSYIQYTKSTTCNTNSRRIQRCDGYILGIFCTGPVGTGIFLRSKIYARARRTRYIHTSCTRVHCLFVCPATAGGPRCTQARHVPVFLPHLGKTDTHSTSTVPTKRSYHTSLEPCLEPSSYLFWRRSFCETVFKVLVRGSCSAFFVVLNTSSTHRVLYRTRISTPPTFNFPTEK